MSLAIKLLSASGGIADKLYVNDVFSTYLYTGNSVPGANAQTINNVNPNSVSSNETPEDVYDKCYKLYQEEHFTEVLAKLDNLILQYS